jgi:ParB family chromosome partitioning protein
MMKKTLLECSLENIAISDIDLTPGPFCMSYHFKLEQLKESIEKFGVINPPHLLRDPDNNFLIVAGYQRLMAIKELGWHDIVCRVLPDSFSLFDALLFNLNDNLIHRQLNNIEKGMILQRLHRFISTEEIVTNFMPMLGIPSNRQQLELFLGLEDLEEGIKISVATEQLSIRVAGLLRYLEKGDRLAINDLFTSLKWSFNQQWEILQWIKEIASRGGCPMKEIIDSKDIKGVLDTTTMNKPQKAKAIVKLLKYRRFPSLSKAEKLFDKSVSNLSLPLGVKIIPPPFFEGTDYKLEVIFRRGGDLKRTLADLYNISELGHISDFWKGI